MSTILDALEKNRTEGGPGSEEDSILARNARYRVALRRPRRRSRRQPLVVALAAVCLVSILVLLFVIMRAWMNPSLPADGAEAGTEADGRVLLPLPAVPPQGEPIRTPPIRESVQLRTRPLLRPKPPTNVYMAEPTQPDASVAQRRPTPARPASPPATSEQHDASPKRVVTYTLETSSSATDGAQAEQEAASPPPQASDNPNDFLALTGIVLDPKKPLALINERLVYVGGEIQGVRILAIDNSSFVRVEYKGKQYDLRLK